MPIKSMKMSPEEMKDREQSSVLNEPAFPFGLSLHISPEVYEKLEIGEIPSLGETFAILGKAEVTSLNKDKGLDDRQKVSMTLQITDLGVTPGADDDKVVDAGEKLYGSD
jgi:hypothetical protein